MTGESMPPEPPAEGAWPTGAQDSIAAEGGVPPSPPGTPPERNDFTPRINLTDVGGIASDIAFVRTDGGLRGDGRGDDGLADVYAGLFRGRAWEGRHVFSAGGRGRGARGRFTSLRAGFYGGGR